MFPLRSELRGEPQSNYMIIPAIASFALVIGACLVAFTWGSQNFVFALLLTLSLVIYGFYLGMWMEHYTVKVAPWALRLWGWIIRNSAI